MNVDNAELHIVGEDGQSTVFRLQAASFGLTPVAAELSEADLRAVKALCQMTASFRMMGRRTGKTFLNRLILEALTRQPIPKRPKPSKHSRLKDRWGRVRG